MTPIPEVFDNSSSVVLGDVMSRLGNLEEQVREILPAISRVAEGMDNLAVSVREVKGDVKDLGNSIVQYKVESAGFEKRIADLEKNDQAKKKEVSDQKARIVSIAGGALASLAVAALVYFFGLR